MKPFLPLKRDFSKDQIAFITVFGCLSDVSSNVISRGGHGCEDKGFDGEWRLSVCTQTCTWMHIRSVGGVDNQEFRIAGLDGNCA